MVRQVFSCVLLLVLQGVLIASCHALDAAGVEVLQRNISERLSAEGGLSSGPEEFRKAAFFQLPPSVLAVVFVKPNADDCAARTATRKSRCKVQIWRQSAPRSWSFQYGFEFVYQPVAAAIGGGNLKTLWVSISEKSTPDYRRLAVDGSEIVFSPEVVLADEVSLSAHMQLDDRNTSSLAETIRLLRNGPARLAPARILYDEINSFLDAGRYEEATYRLLLDAKDKAVAILLPSIDRDLQTVAARIPWSQRLDVRARICSDWLVPREFWKTEARRLSTLGFCLDPIIHLAALGRTQTRPELPLRLARFYVFNEVGVAYLFRNHPVSLRLKQELVRSGNTGTIVALGAAAGTIIAAKASIQAPSERLAAARNHASFLDEWFELMEKKRGYTAPTQELTRSQGIAQRQIEGIQCAVALLPKPPPGVRCSEELEPFVKDIARSLAGE